jgi:hypothetical protein
MESIGHRFEHGDSPGRCRDDGTVEAGQNDGTRRWWRRLLVACGGEHAREARNTPGFLEEQREREARGSLEPTHRQRIPTIAFFTAAGKGLNLCGS